MLRPMTFDERLQYITCRIESRFESGSSAVGTAFYYGHRIDERRIAPVIVTNRHVIWDEQYGPAVGGKFQVHTSRSVGGVLIPAGVFHHVEFVEAEYPFHEFWVPHPDPEVDLCAMPALPLKYVMNALGSVPYINVIGDDLTLAQHELDLLNVVEDVVMVGYPTGLWDDVHNLPLFRKGTTASHPAQDFQGRPMFVVDLACFPGSSGSPVFAVREQRYPLEPNDAAHDPRRFLGVLHAGPTLPGGALVNLGFVIKASKVRELGGHLWEHFTKLGYIPTPWSSEFDNKHLPPGAMLPDNGGAFRAVADLEDATTMPPVDADEGPVTQG